MSEYGYDHIDGKRVPHLVITSDFTLTGVHEGTIQVEAGILTINGELRGSLNVHENAQVIIRGKQNGSISLKNGASTTVYGQLNGSSHLSSNSTVIIEERGRLAGSLTNEGKVILRGVFGGTQFGNGTISIEGNGYIKQPTKRGDSYFYEW